MGHKHLTKIGVYKFKAIPRNRKQYKEINNKIKKQNQMDIPIRNSGFMMKHQLSEKKIRI